MKLLTASRPAHVKVICPTAAKMPVSLNSGFQMPSWFDLLSLDPDGKEDEAGIKRAAQLVDLLIDEEVKTSGLSSERVLVGGFSQVKYFWNCNSKQIFSILTHTENIIHCRAERWLCTRRCTPGTSWRAWWRCPAGTRSTSRSGT